MHLPFRRRATARFIVVAVAMLMAGPLWTLAADASASTAAAPTLTVVARDLAHPQKLTLTSVDPESPGLNVVVALAGRGRTVRSCRTGAQKTCIGNSGGVDLVTPLGHVVNELSGLASAATGVRSGVAAGPVQSYLINQRFFTLMSNAAVDPLTGQNPYGPSWQLGDLTFYRNHETHRRTIAAFGPYEAQLDPDRHAVGTVAKYGGPTVASDPSALVPYRGGFVVTDAAANDVLWVSPRGRISVLAVLPTIREYAPPHTFGELQSGSVEAQAQAAPSSVTIGPDGAIYVGEFGGLPFATGHQDVYRIVPGHRPTVYAKGLTAIEDLSFDSAGHLLVLELDQRGLRDPRFGTANPASGVILQVGPGVAPQVIVNRGLPYATGMVAGPDGLVYVTTNGLTNHGELLRFTM